MDVLGLLAAAPLHLGNLHPVERFLVLLVAFGPFVVLGIVVYVVRKRDLAAEEGEAHNEATLIPPSGPDQLRG